MAEPFALDASVRYAFAPSPEPVESVMYRIHIVFECSDSRLWSAGTDLMSVTAESAAVLCDGMNARLGFDRHGWTALADRVFAERPNRNNGPKDEPFEFP